MDPTIISWMMAMSALATTVSTFFFGTLSDRRGQRRRLVALGYILWGMFTIAFGLTQYITGGSVSATAKVVMVAAAAAVLADTVMSFFGSMGNDSGFNAWLNDNITDHNRGQLGAAIAIQPVLGTIVGTFLGGILVGSDNNYMRLFLVMGSAVIAFGFIALVFMKDAPTLVPNRTGTFSQQFFSVFDFQRFFRMKELVWVNLSLSVYFIAFNMYFAHIGNYIIYYLGFTAKTMCFIEGISLVAAMLVVIPATGLINRNKSPLLCGISTLLNFAGVLLLGLFVRPDSVNTESVFNLVLLLGVFFIGAGYILFLQAAIVWSKQLYPQDSRGQFEGVRILFFVLIPMVIGPLLANPIIKKSGQFVDEYGFTKYLPTHTLFLIASVLVLLTFIPLYFARRYHNERIHGNMAPESGANS